MVHDSIKEVLNKNKRVIIPDIGAIIIDDDFSNSIFFNEYIKFDDDAITEHLAESQDISMEKATKELAKYVKSIKKALDSNKAFEIKGLGFIQLDKYNKIIIDQNAPTEGETETPLAESIHEEDKAEAETTTTAVDYDNYPPDLGEDTEVPMNDEKEQTETTLDNNLQEDMNELDDNEIDELNPYEDDISEPTDTEYSTDELDDYPEQGFDEVPEEKKKSALPTILAVLGVLLIAAGSVWYFYIRENEDNFFSKLVKQEMTTSDDAEVGIGDDEVADDEVTQEGEMAAEEAITEASNGEGNNGEAEEMDQTAAATEEPTVEEAPATSGYNQTASNNSVTASITSEAMGKFSVVIGSFREESNADNYTAKLNGEGYDVNKFISSGDIFFVGYNNIQSFREANEYLEKAREVEENAWIKQARN